ncbi:tRNA epoxyqueuosine(34) reductase QueG [Bacteroidia bacterium]|nr:tRNA epoxyqueuosine(34) reductase QueG [Bacteroidia bacterium]MDB9882734.1 tRNA epoxyqueuosine(34) reductase QueG [Bacteroidia bacterium]MDC1395893.1 tRNA epoxyqueuosine(34) reductase QueG [Bacteroidia bacterium]
MSDLTHLHSKIVKDISTELGFDFCGISKAQKLENDAANLDRWLTKGYHGKMAWMENNFEKRVDPTLLVPGAKSVISLLFNYYPEENYDDAEIKISKYAYGTDYHFVIKDRLKSFLQLINERIGEVDGRVFVDSAPVLDRAWAAKSGLGWIGKNAMLITKQKGSYYFIAELIVDLELDADLPITDHCGTCTACIDACPTDAIVADKVVDSTKCISYLTIELRENIPASFKNQMEGWAFGCDICQDVCPWNRFAAPHSSAELKIREGLSELHAYEWQELTEIIFKDIFKKSAIKRAGFMKLKENIEFCKDTD